jgi:hypothetical protein
MKNSLFSVVFMLFCSFAISAQTKSVAKCETTVSAETGAFSSYIGDDVGETYYGHPVVQGWIEVERCGNRRNSYGFNAWGSLSTKKNPSEGTELDLAVFTNHRFKKNVTVHLEGAVFFLVEGLKIYKASAAVSKEFEVNDKVEGNLTNTTNFYWVNRSEVPGGVTNKTAVDFKTKLGKKASLTISPAVSFDNNPFGYGPRGLVGIGYLNGRVDVPLSNKVTFFVTGGVSNPIFGDTTRGFRKFAGVGLAFQIR